MPIEVRRFGVGHRRPDGPPGTTGIQGQVIQSGPTGVVAELAFGRVARITPHSNPNTTYLLVIEGGGWVQVGDERTRVQAGEAVVWPAGIVHSAWTEGAPMRAIAVELPDVPLALPATVVAAALPPTTGRPVQRGEGRLAPRRPTARAEVDGDEETVEGEPR